MPYASAPSVLQPFASAAPPQLGYNQPPLQPIAGVGGVPVSPQPTIATPMPQASVDTPAYGQDISSVRDDSDDDAINVEWVGKAHEVVERTHADPYLQSKELSHIKAQYIKARYNKDIKVSEDQQ